MIVVAGMMGLPACSHKVENEIDRKVAEEQSINTMADLNAESDRLLESAEGLSAEQRASLVELRQKTRAQIAEQNREALRLRSVLAKEMFAPAYDRREISALRNNMRKADEKKTDLFLDAVKESNLILGRPERDRADRFDYDNMDRGYNF